MARQDPLRNQRFRVEVDGLAAVAFSEVSIGATTTDVIEYREGGDPLHVRKLPGLHRFGNVTLSRGVTESLDLVQWQRLVLQGQTADARRRVVIVVADEAGADRARWIVSDAWPVKLELGRLDARGNEVLIETLELANEGIERVA